MKSTETVSPNPRALPDYSALKLQIHPYSTLEPLEVGESENRSWLYNYVSIGGPDETILCTVAGHTPIKGEISGYNKLPCSEVEPLAAEIMRRWNAVPELVALLGALSAEDSQCEIEQFRQLKKAARSALTSLNPPPTP